MELDWIGWEWIETQVVLESTHHYFYLHETLMRIIRI